MFLILLLVLIAGVGGSYYFKIDPVYGFLKKYIEGDSSPSPAPTPAPAPAPAPAPSPSSGGTSGYTMKEFYTFK